MSAALSSPSSSSSHFTTAVDAILKNWTALQLAVSQNAAGSDSPAVAQWMVGAVVQWFGENKNLQTFEVAEFLEDIVSKEFNVMIDDGSTDEIGTLMCDFYALCSNEQASDAEIVEKLRKLPRCDLSRCQINNEDGEPTGNINNVAVAAADDADGMEVVEDEETSTGKSTVLRRQEPDEDGWTTVSKKK